MILAGGPLCSAWRILVWPAFTCFFIFYYEKYLNMYVCVCVQYQCILCLCRCPWESLKFYLYMLHQGWCNLSLSVCLLDPALSAMYWFLLSVNSPPSLQSFWGPPLYYKFLPVSNTTIFILLYCMKKNKCSPLENIYHYLRKNPLVKWLVEFWLVYI